MAAETDTRGLARNMVAAALAQACAAHHGAVTATVMQARQQRVQALGLRGWSRSLRRRDRRARFEAAMLREEAQSLYQAAPATARYASRAGVRAAAGPEQ